jgi:hypothetical protein
MVRERMVRERVKDGERVVLGDALTVLEPGPTLAANRAKMPPGNFLMVRLSCRL